MFCACNQFLSALHSQWIWPKRFANLKASSFLNFNNGSVVALHKKYTWWSLLWIVNCCCCCHVIVTFTRKPCSLWKFKVSDLFFACLASLVWLGFTGWSSDSFRGNGLLQIIANFRRKLLTFLSICLMVSENCLLISRNLGIFPLFLRCVAIL